MSLEYQNERWRKDFDKIEKDYDNLVEWWRKNKSCDCDSEEDDIFCKHYLKLVKKTLGKRIDKSFNEIMHIGFATLYEVKKL